MTRDLRGLDAIGVVRGSATTFVPTIPRSVAPARVVTANEVLPPSPLPATARASVPTQAAASRAVRTTAAVTPSRAARAVADSAAAKRRAVEAQKGNVRAAAAKLRNTVNKAKSQAARFRKSAPAYSATLSAFVVSAQQKLASSSKIVGSADPFSSILGELVGDDDAMWSSSPLLQSLATLTPEVLEKLASDLNGLGDQGDKLVDQGNSLIDTSPTPPSETQPTRNIEQPSAGDASAAPAGGGGGNGDGDAGAGYGDSGAEDTAPEPDADADADAEDTDAIDQDDDIFSELVGELRGRRHIGADVIPTAGKSYTDPATVSAVQRALQRKGFDPGPIDGEFGPKTKKAIRLMQVAAGIPETGVIDEGVLMALGVRAPKEGDRPRGEASLLSPQGEPAASPWLTYFRKPVWTGSPIKIWQATVGAAVAVVLSSALLAFRRN